MAVKEPLQLPVWHLCFSFCIFFKQWFPLDSPHDETPQFSQDVISSFSQFFWDLGKYGSPVHPFILSYLLKKRDAQGLASESVKYLNFFLSQAHLLTCLFIVCQCHLPYRCLYGFSEILVHNTLLWEKVPWGATCQNLLCLQAIVSSALQSQFSVETTDSVAFE